MTAAAYNVVMKDVLPADMVVFGTPTANIAGAVVSVLNGGHEIDVTLDKLAVGAAPVVLTYQTKMLDSVTPGQTLTDTASLAYTTQSTTLTTSTGNGRALTAPSSSASQPVNLTPALVKSVLAVSDTHLVTPAGAAPSVAVGDIVTYKLLVTPGHGTQRLVLKDVLGAGLTYQGITFASAGGATAAAPVVTNSGGTVTMDFGTIVNPGGNNGAIEVDRVYAGVELVAAPPRAVRE
jgi:fimbrial isopeptide formation D2 family protein